MNNHRNKKDRIKKNDREGYKRREKEKHRRCHK